MARERTLAILDVSDGDRMVTALDAPVDLGGVLLALADTILASVGADQVAIFLLEGRRLHPAVATSGAALPDLLSTFRAMGPVEVSPGNWEVLMAGPAVAIRDAREIDVVPAAWVETFGLRGLAMASVRHGERPLGLLAAVWSKPRTFTPAELQRIEALGAYVGAAVQEARPFETVRRRARLQQALARGAATLSELMSPDEVIRRLAHSFTELLGPQVCAIALVDDVQQKMTAVTSRGGREIDPFPLSDIPEHILTLLGETWADDKRPIELKADPWLVEVTGAARSDVSWYLAVPFVMHGHTRGGVLLGFSAHTVIDAEERATAVSLAAFGAAALERSELLDRLDANVRRLDALYRASAALTEGADVSELLAELNDLLASHGVEVVGVTFRDQRLARHLGSEKTISDASQGFGDGEVLAVPMRLGRRLVGSLAVQPAELAADQLSFLEALATDLAQVASRNALRVAVEESARERAITNERERMAADLHDTVGQLFVALGLQARRLGRILPDGSTAEAQAVRVAELADNGKTELDHALRALAFLPAAQHGLAPALQALCLSFSVDSGIQVDFEHASSGARRPRLGSHIEEALYRVGHQALANAWRHARCSSIHMSLSFTHAEVMLRVADDGCGLGPEVGAVSPGLGLASMRRSIEAVDGALLVENGETCGTVVEARALSITG